ncbi:MAG: hypothetical protein ACYC8W_02080 [Candidatus Tyrphobacter sp.]
MSRRFPIGLVIVIFAIVAIGLTLRFVAPREFGRITTVASVKNAPSDVYASLDIRYDHPPIYSETYAVRDNNGASSYSYTIVRADGPRTRERVTIEAPPHATYEVSFFLGRLQSDGIWDVPSRPARGDTAVTYALTVRQTETYQHGAHTVTFTDPHYWATSAGREFHLHLSPKGPLPNILQLQGTSIRDPRYEQIVGDFRSFGPPQFRAEIARARAKAHL